eukprot:TRINITY_DN62665_c0_g1_i1.p1 TRINITY_DN62665_c0_g1~~TRINITY_DN62665_c0_g1_i1.p1  ORF type:complete len:219 (+),score=61.48 TRINITY_DN62665_c0_g1_i1:226-882(+)
MPGDEGRGDKSVAEERPPGERSVVAGEEEALCGSQDVILVNEVPELCHIEPEQECQCAVCLEYGVDPALRYPCRCTIGFHPKCFQQLLEKNPKFRKQCVLCSQKFVRLGLDMRKFINNLPKLASEEAAAAEEEEAVRLARGEAAAAEVAARVANTEQETASEAAQIASEAAEEAAPVAKGAAADGTAAEVLSLIHISEPTRLLSISYAVFCLKKKKKT